jgi:CO/xanthine dehydrogenase Mo-binding subunit
VRDAIEVHVGNRPAQPFLGSGEAWWGPAAAAVANAVANATGLACAIRRSPPSASRRRSGFD